MTTHNPLAETLMALLNIQHNLLYIEEQLDVLKIDVAERTSIKRITSSYFAELFDCQEELAALGQEDGMIVIDPLLYERNDGKTKAERATVILNILEKHNAFLTKYTDSLIAKRDKMAGDTTYDARVILMTESVGNILKLTKGIFATLTPLTITTATSMLYTPLLHKAFHYSIKVHEIDQKQKRKGKDVPYVTHPIHAGFILARAGAPDAVIAAGFLHDTLEDSVPEAKVTKDMLEHEFGTTVAELVASVTEKNRAVSWHERKEAALEEIRHFSHDSILLKSGDVISNTSEMIGDYAQTGDDTFNRFNAPKAQIIEHAQRVIRTLLEAWPENPLAGDLEFCYTGLERMK